MFKNKQTGKQTKRMAAPTPPLSLYVRWLMVLIFVFDDTTVSTTITKCVIVRRRRKAYQVDKSQMFIVS